MNPLFATSNDLTRIAFEINGTGTPLMLLHGGGGSRADWQEAGIPPADILRSATIVPAQFMSLGDCLGSISEGKMASVVLIRANPLEDIRNAQQIESVFLRGQNFSREDLDRLLDEAKELAQQATTP